MARISDGDILIAVPAGALGSGVRAEEVEAALAAGASAIALDAGSTDSGPYYLARATSKSGRDAIRRDLAILMEARARARVPLLIGSCGTSGCDEGVNWTRDIVLEIAAERGLTPRIALLYSEQSRETIKAKAATGKVAPLAPLGPIDEAAIDSCDHIVALMGPEPYIAALEQGADIVLGGRTTDTAVLAAYPLMKGIEPGLAWHAAKLTECGGLCTVQPSSPGVQMRMRQGSFDISPLAAGNRCTPQSVSAHMLYENSDPFLLVEPGGVLDVAKAEYNALDARSVRVTGSRWRSRPYTMKLEGAGGGPFQTIMLVGIAAPDVLASIDLFIERLYGALRDRIAATIGDAAGDFDISLRPYGWNAVSGRPPSPGTPSPQEIGLLFVATARSQEMATRIAKACNPYFFHFPLTLTSELPSYAFPFSPAEIERGQVFEFRLNHVVETEGPFELVRTAWVDLQSPARAEA